MCSKKLNILCISLWSINIFVMPNMKCILQTLQNTNQDIFDEIRELSDPP